MDPKRLIIGSVVGTIVLNVTGFLVWGMLLADFFAAHQTTPGLEREVPIWWAVVVGGLLWSALITTILDSTDTKGMLDSFKCAAVVGLMVVGGMDLLVLYGIFDFSDLVGLVADIGLSALQFGLAGVAIAAVGGMGGDAAAAE